jgi:putative membrane protein
MSSKLRLRYPLLTALIASQALVFGAYAQVPDETPPPRDRATSPDANRSTGTPRSPSTASTERHAGMKAVTPEKFASQAAVISKAEIELGQLAMQKSEDQAVRSFAQRMVKDHQAADAKLKKIAAQENITLPQSLDPEHQALKQKLSKLDGEAFDREYAKQMEKGHDEAVALFESASQNQQMPSELKQFAASTLPTLKEHQELAESLHGKEGA